MSDWRHKWEEEARALAARFYPEVRATFSFLEATYGYRFVEEQLRWPEDYRDTQADVTYAGEQMEVTVLWYFSSGVVDVDFRTLPTPWQYPDGVSEEARGAPLPVGISLYSLAKFLGTAHDPDFVLGDIWNLYESKAKKRDTLIRGNLRGVLEGFARATERYASAMLHGDTSQFAAVAAFYDAHHNNYWKHK